MAYNVTTEWEDIQVKHGNFIPSIINEDQYEKEKENKEKYHSECLNNDNKIEDDELFDNLDEEDLEFERQYKAKLMQRNQFISSQITSKSSIRLNNMDDYNLNILKVVDDRLIFLVLYKDNISKSVAFERKLFDYVYQLMLEYELTNSNLIIYKMIATDCLTHFEDKDIPSLLLFCRGVILKKFICCFDYFMPNGENDDINKEKVKDLVNLAVNNKNYNIKKSEFKNEFENTYKTYNKEEDKYVMYKNDREYNWK